MRSTLFRTVPLLVGPYDAEVLKDMDGASPFTLFLENLDVAASLRTKFGSKNANVRFVAVSAGDAGNDISVEITAGPSQAFSVGVATDAVTINLRCDADGLPNQLAADVIDQVNADVGAAAKVRTSLALGSDGSATMEIPDFADAPTVVMAATNLDGGFDATDLADAVVEYSSTGAPDFAGPWFRALGAEAAFNAPYGASAGSVGAYTFTAPFRGLRVTLQPGAAATMPVVSAVRSKAS
jgi:hypothetical protein